MCLNDASLYPYTYDVSSKNRILQKTLFIGYDEDVRIIDTGIGERHMRRDQLAGNQDVRYACSPYKWSAPLLRPDGRVWVAIFERGRGYSVVPLPKSHPLAIEQLRKCQWVAGRLCLEEMLADARRGLGVGLYEYSDGKYYQVKTWC